MVFSSVIASVINRFLSPFVDELTANQLNVFAWSGQVSLSDVSVKPNAFDSLKLPFRIIHGHIGRIEASVPWMNIYAEPIVIKISDVYVVAVPKTEIKYDENEELQYEWGIKKAYLENIEAMKQKLKDELEHKKNDDGFFMKLVVAAIKNVQIFIHNVHICYEDSTSYRKNVFQIGLSFSKLVFETENKVDKKTSNDQIIHKLVKLEEFSFYLNSKKVKRLVGLKFNQINEALKNRISSKISDMEYILCPINFLSEAILHRKPEIDAYKIPIVDVNMNLDHFRIQLTNYQIQTMLLLLDSIDRMRNAAPYRKWRPAVSIKENPLMWWKFLYTSIVETGIRRKKREFSWKNIQETCLKRKTYTDLYRKKLLGENVGTLEELEQDLNLITIVMARSRAELDTKKILESRKANEKTKRGWFAGWWSSSTSNVKNDEVIANIKNEFTPQEKEKLYKAIGYEENSLLQLYPPEFVAHRLKFKINLFKISILQETQNLMNVEFNGCNFEFFNRPSSSNLFFMSELESLTIVGKNDAMLLKGKQNVEFLAFKFEMNPLDKQFDFSVDLSMKSSYILYDIETINHLYRMLKPPESVLLEEFQSYAQYKLSDLKQMTALGIEYAVEKHKQMKLNISIDPSFVVVPKLADISSANSIALLSLGKFSLTSKLVSKSNIPKIRDMTEKGADQQRVIEEMKKLIYEKYTCHIQNVQVVLSDIHHWKDDLEMLDTDRHILCPFEILLNINRSIIPQDPNFAKLILYGEIPIIELRASDSQISQLLGLFITLPFGPTFPEISSAKISAKDFVDKGKINQNIKKIFNNEVNDAFNYATQTVEKIEKSEPKEEVAIKSEDNVDSAADGRPLIIHKDFIFEFQLKSILLTIYRLNRNVESALAQFQLKKFSLYGEILTDSTMWMNCTVSDLILDDIRHTRKESGIRSILRKSGSTTSKSKSIVTVYIAQKSTERIIVITMSGFSFILALDYLLGIIDISTNAFTFAEDQSIPKLASIERVSSSNKSTKDSSHSNVVNIIEFDLNKMEIFMLESLDVPNADACIFACYSKINIRVDQNVIMINGEVSKITMSLANYVQYIANSEVEAYIMSPTDLTINGSIKGSRQMIDLNFNDISIIISPQMVSIVLAILSTMGSAPKTNTNEASQTESIENLMKIRPINRKAWYLNCAPTAKEALDLIKKDSSEENQLIFNMSSIKVLIKSSGLSSQPLIRFSISNYAKLIANKKFYFDCSMTADYFNHTLMSWEPLIEPVNNEPFTFHCDLHLDESCNKMKIETLQNLELLLTKSSVHTLHVISNAFSSVLSYTKSFGKIQENRVIIRNYLGIDIDLNLTKSNVLPSIRIEGSTHNRVVSTMMKTFKIKSGDQETFTTTDLSKVELFVNLNFSDSVIVERKILCQSSSVRSYFTSIKTYPSNENWKWIVQVHDSGTLTKDIEFRSNTQIVNNFECPFLLYSYHAQQSSLIGEIKSLSTYYLPLKLVYGQELLYIRPSEEFELSDIPVDWRNIDLNEVPESESCSDICSPYASPKTSKKFLLLSCKRKQDSDKNFHIKVRGERFNVLYEDTERLDNDESFIYNIRFIPFVRLKNLLPYYVEFSYDPVETEQRILEPGEEFNLPYALFGKSKITYKVLHYLGCDWTSTIVLPESGRENENRFYKFMDTETEEYIYLAVNYSIDKSSLILSIFSPFWMVNHTDRSISYRIDSKHIFKQRPNMTTPYLLCFDPENVSKKDKLSLSICDSHFSEYFPLNVVPYTGSYLPQDKSKRFSYCVNVRVELARIGISKIISISSFYSVFNISKQNIEYSENGEDWFLIEIECSKSFFPIRTENQRMSFRFAGRDTCSKYVSLRTSSQTLLSFDNKHLFVEIDVTEMEAKIKISDYFDGAAPVLIINDLDSNLYYGQKNVTDWKSEKHIHELPAKKIVYFCWIEPLETREFAFKLDLEELNEQSMNLDFDQYVKINGNCGWVTFFDGKQRVLIFTTDTNLPQYLLRTEEITKPNMTLEVIMKGLGINIVNNEKKKDLLYLSISSTFLWEERKTDGKHYRELSFKENNILEDLYQAHKLSTKNRNTPVVKTAHRDDYEIDFTRMLLIRPRVSYLRRASNRGLWFSYSSSEHIKQYHIKINRVQIDNQLSDHIFDVAFTPVIVPKSIYDNFELQQKSFIEASAIIQSLGSVTRFKYLQILIQEFMVQVDWGWVCMIMNVFDIETSKEDSNKILIAKDLDNLFQNNTLKEMQKFVMRKTYYDYLLLGPLKMHLSIAVGDLPDGKFPFGLDFIIRFTGLTLGEINDTLFKLDYFERKMIFLAESDLTNQIIDHYKTQIYMQVYKLILGLDIIGNPMKLVLGIKKGVGDFFYEPAMGIIHGPEEFAEGIATGVKSLASGVLGGTAGALGRIGNRIGTGVAALTIDEKFQKERRERMNRKTGFAESGKNLLRGIVSGVTGVVTKPIEGAKEEGVEGLFKGFGLGVVGIVAQPATGVIDFASGSLQAFNEVIDPKQVAKPMRPARNFVSSHEITPYLLQTALGNEILRNLSEGKYANEEYEFHLQINSHLLILFTKAKLFCLKKSILSSGWECEWSENWINCQKVVRESGKLRLFLKESKKSFLLFSGARVHTIPTTNNDHIKALCFHINRHINSEENAD